ncbi:hypothetical protein [Clavibacter michiganensis]|uniref:hypothetical protein n=2 Tax=Clavibacter michiganensis TaxID=28447 RepID=UPI00292D4501|nr:hypothetical protein [Clavibacter michiganensis]
MVTYRRARNSMVKPVATGWKIEEATRDRIEELAQASRRSASEFFDELVVHLLAEANEDGTLPWLPPKELPKPKTTPGTRQEEFDIDSR